MKKTLKSLLEISDSIKSIYETLNIAEINNDKKLYNQYLEYLKLVNEEEDKLYEKLNVSTENADILVLNLLEISEKNDSSVERISIYFKQLLYNIPFLSTAYYSDEQEENNYIIETQFCNDYTINILRNFKY